MNDEMVYVLNVELPFYRLKWLVEKFEHPKFKETNPDKRNEPKIFKPTIKKTLS